MQLASSPPLRITLFLFLIAWTAAAAPAQTGVGEIQATIAGNHLYIPLRVNGQDAQPWLVDTGAVACIVSSVQAKRLNLESPPPGSIAATVRDGKPRPVMIASDVSCGSMSFGKVPVVVYPEGVESEHINRSRNRLSSGGVVGLSLLAKYGAVISYTKGQVFFSIHGGTLPIQRQKYEQMGYTYVPLEAKNNHRLEVIGTAAGSTYSFIIDTGAAHTLLFDAIRQKARVAAYDLNIKAKGPFHDFRNPHLWTSRLPGFRLGNVDVGDTSIGFGQMDFRERGLSYPFGGFIGPDILATHSAIIDIGHRALYLKSTGSRG
jgi:predicted aspartyl protease